MIGDKQHLIELANYKMPFGRFEGRYLVYVPEAYYVWYKGKGFPAGKLGRMMQEMYEIKVNGLEYLLIPLIEKK